MKGSIMLEAFVAEIYSNNDPLTVVVNDDEWTTIEPRTPREIWLYTLLTVLGGLSDSTPPGIYHFNMKSDWFKMKLTLDPIEI